MTSAAQLNALPSLTAHAFLFFCVRCSWYQVRNQLNIGAGHLPHSTANSAACVAEPAPFPVWSWCWLNAWLAAALLQPAAVLEAAHAENAPGCITLLFLLYILCRFYHICRTPRLF